MLRAGGALDHIWGVGWCLEAWSIGALKHWRCTSVDHVFVMLECILDAFEWWFELIKCIKGYLS